MSPAAVEVTPARRRMITMTVMVATLLQSLDTTIANVALPDMRGSFSASREEVAWVLTSYIVAAAVMTPLTGWLASRFGRRKLFLVSIVSFTLTSLCCGMSQSLAQIVLFRLLQGLSGAALIPMAQAVLFDINPPEHYGRAMAAWSQGVLLGPILGPIVGGWLTDTYSWHWVFLINVPIGVAACIGVLAFFPKDDKARDMPFDFFGFVLLSVAVGALQLMLDRGSGRDWFQSTEICIEALVAGLAFYLVTIHFATARHPFVRPALFKDRNFLMGGLFALVVGVVVYSTLTLLPSMLQTLLHYSTYEAGFLTAARSSGSFIAMVVVGRLIGRIDSRLIIGVGMTVCAFSLYQMSHFSLLMDSRPVIYSGLIQGLGTGLTIVPVTALTFATLSGEYRNEGSALNSLFRNIGGSVGISVVMALLTHSTQVAHADLVENITQYNLAARNPDLAQQLISHGGLTAVNASVTEQATMIAYINDFHLMFILSLLTLPLLFLLRTTRTRIRNEETVHAME